MADLVVIVPTRGRAGRFREMVDAALSTAAGNVEIIACVDEDDPTWRQYDFAGCASFLKAPRMSLSAWSNFAANMATGRAPFLASLGDDHRPRTQGWDTALMAAAEQVDGWAYGNDLLQGGRLPTAWVVRSDIVRQLGWLMLPACAHMYVDNAVLELGRRTSRIAYVPRVVIEHQHPLAGGTDWDDSYRETNAAERFAADKAAFEAWLADGIERDIAAIGVRS